MTELQNVADSLLVEILSPAVTSAQNGNKKPGLGIGREV
jgi:hypothetical protein